MRGQWVLMGAVALLAGALAGSLSYWWRQRPATREEGPPAATAPPTAELRLEGVIGARNVVSVPPPIPGTLEMVLVDVGVEVHEGMLLAQIHNTAIESELALAKAELADAESAANQAESALMSARLEASRAAADLARAREDFEAARRNAERQQLLYRKGATPRQVYDKYDAEFRARRQEHDTIAAASKLVSDKVAEAERGLDEARRNVERIQREIEEINKDLAASQVISPVNGVLTAMAARQGEEVQLGMEALFQIATDLSQLTVNLDPSPAEMEYLKPGQSVLVYVAEMGGEPIEGSITQMSVGRAVVEFSSPNPAIRPGLTAQVVVRVPR